MWKCSIEPNCSSLSINSDMIGMTHEFNPRFLRRYMNLYEEMSQAIAQYGEDVKSGDFPNDNEQY